MTATPFVTPTFFSTVSDFFRADSRNAALSALSPLERLVMHWLFKRMLRARWPEDRFTQVMAELSHVTRKHFSESNDPTVDAFLRDNLEAAIAKTSVCGSSQRPS